MPDDPLPYAKEQIGQIPDGTPIRATLNYYLRVIKAIIGNGGGVGGGAAVYFQEDAPVGAPLNSLWIKPSELGQAMAGGMAAVAPIDAIETIPDPINDEFEGDELDPKWTRFQAHGTMTAEIVNKKMVIACSVDDARLQGMAIPLPDAATFTVNVKCTLFGKLSAENSCGIALKNGADYSSQYVVGALGGGMGAAAWPAWNNRTTDGRFGKGKHDVWLQVEKADKYYLRYSPDGEEWVTYWAIPFDFVATHLGLFIVPWQSGGELVKGKFEYVRRVA